MTAKITLRSLVAMGVAVMLASVTWNAFAGSNTRESAAVSSSSTHSDAELSGEQLWTMNCQRCHNLQPPTRFSDPQWDVIVHHMRVRANITGAEQRAILEFLKSSN